MGNVFSSTTKLWFCGVIWHLDVLISIHGWFILLLPNFNFFICAPTAIDNNWCPKQIPNIGIFLFNCIKLLILLIVLLHNIGFPGPLLINKPSNESFVKS